MRHVLSLVCFSSLICAAFLIAVGQEKSNRETSDLAGRYSFVSGEKNGGESPDENLKDSKVSITAKEIIATDKSDKRTYVATYTLDKSKEPWRISMESLVPTIGAKAEGLVSVDGETLKIIYALPGAEAPTEFKTKKGQHLWVLKAEKDAKANQSAEKSAGEK